MPESESSASPEESAPEEKPSVGQNPAAGCIIMVIALCSLAFLIGFGIWSLFQQNREIAKFTDSEPQKVPLLVLEEHESAMIGLNAKLEIFQTNQGNKRDAVLKLSPEEINLAIAAFDGFEELRNTFSVKSITSGEVQIEIAFKMRGSPTKPDDFRYLNGTMVTKPELTGGEIIFIVERIDVPGKTVPDGFVGVFSPYRPGQRYLEHEALGPWMKRLTSISFEDGFMTLSIKPSEVPPDTELPEIETRHIVRFAVLLGAILLGFVAIAIMAIQRGKRTP